MSACSHALYIHLTQDLQRHLPNHPEFFAYAETQFDLGPCPSVKTVASVQLIRSIFKKNIDDVSASADSAALELFILMNEKCKSYVFPDIWTLSEPLLQVLTHAKSLLEKWTCNGSGLKYSDAEILHCCDFGPGASIGASGNSFYHKTGCSKLSMTDPLLYSIYIESIRYSKTWIKAESLRRDLFGRPDIVRESKLCFVPKSTKISRTICTEPSLNMFLQKGLAAFLTDCLRKSISIDLADQQFRNKRLARRGSRTGRFGTIDLSSASDTISLSLCEYLLPPVLLEWLRLARTSSTLTPSGDRVELHMISSMGNATTFPLQTMIFSAIVLGCYKVLGLKIDKPCDLMDGNFGVFGDDIIVCREAYDLVIASLKTCGFFPNEHKSFNTGLFRESCGGDYFDGHYVRGVYCKTLRNKHDRYSLINRLNVWSANNGILLCKTISYLMSTVRFLPVPPYESDIAGVKVPRSLAGPLKMNSNGSILYRRLSARAISWDVNQTLTPQSRKRFRVVYNPDAIFVSAVKGSLRGGSLSIRFDVVRPCFTVGISPGWDYIDMEHSLLENVGLSVWKQMTSANLCNSLP